MKWLKTSAASLNEKAHENRELRRRGGSGLRSYAELQDGTVLEGNVLDLSAAGARVHGPTQGLHLEENLRFIVIKEDGEKFGYTAQVRHLNREERHYGLAFEGGAEKLDPSYKPKGLRPDMPPWLEEGCPRCGGEFDFGHVVDHMHVTSMVERAISTRWFEGRAERDFRRADDQHLPKQFRIDAYRCSKCGYIESYASQEFH